MVDLGANDFVLVNKKKSERRREDMSAVGHRSGQFQSFVTKRKTPPWRARAAF
jgi:hypothetical protein